MSIKIGSFKGHATISLNAESKYPFTFGVEKAKLVLAHVKEIEAFVAKQGVPAQQGDRFDMVVEDNGAARCGLL